MVVQLSIALSLIDSFLVYHFLMFVLFHPFQGSDGFHPHGGCLYYGAPFGNRRGNNSFKRGSFIQ